jgi:hypothetical protein
MVVKISLFGPCSQSFTSRDKRSEYLTHFMRLLALKRLKFLFFSNRLKSLTGQPSLILAKSDVSLLSIEIKVFFSKKCLKNVRTLKFESGKK